MLSKAGFNALSVENNHSLDLGENGKQNTINTLEKSNITALAYDNSPQFFKIRGLTLAIVAINLIPGSDNKCQKVLP